MTRQLVYEDETGCFELEEGPQGMLFAHCEVKQWSKSIYKQHLQIWYNILNQLEDKGVTHLHTMLSVNDNKALKYNMMMGFTPVYQTDSYVICMMEI